ncbi:MAG: hypothetical protein WAU48_12845 [Gammaproteobacteria bacterium]
MLTFIKYLWAAPCTAVGACLGAVMMCVGAKLRLRAGIAEVAFLNSTTFGAQALHRLPIGSITFGHVVLARTEQEQARLRIHERAHVTQYEKWGILLFVLYPVSSLAQAVRGGHAYRDNHFEVQARAAEQEQAKPGLPDSRARFS